MKTLKILNKILLITFYFFFILGVLGITSFRTFVGTGFILIITLINKGDFI
jgi:hypothetical protein